MASDEPEFPPHKTEDGLGRPLGGILSGAVR
jgi:hypothetical protein